MSARVTINETTNPSTGPSGVLRRLGVTAYPGSYGVLRVPRHHLVGMDCVPLVSPTFLMQREVAEPLRLPECTLEDWRLTSQGRPYLKLGRHVRYDLTDVIDWAREQRHG